MIALLLSNQLWWSATHLESASAPEWLAAMSAAMGFLPAPAIEKIAAYLLSGPDSQTGLLSLMALAGVDKHTRSVVSRLRSEHTLTFDSLESCSQKTLGRPMFAREVRFARASADSKTVFFVSAARLFNGYSEAAFVGQGVTDLLQLEVARNLQHGLQAVRLQGCPAVTDSGINTLLLLCPNLERLQLEKLPLVCGLFLPSLARHCTCLHALQLVQIPGFKWSVLEPQLKALPALRRLQSLRIVDVGLGASHAQLIFTRLPNLRWLSLDGGPANVQAAVAACCKLKEVHYSPQPGGRGVDEALAALAEADALKVLELHPQGAIMTAAQLRRAGQLPLSELRLESSAFRSTPAITPATPSHVDDHGIRALVDSICRRWRIDQAPQPFKLSLRGATAITHDAVSSLLRLPMLTELRIDGCPRIQALDKMRLIAKVKAGRELLELEEKRKQCLSRSSNCSSRSSSRNSTFSMSSGSSSSVTSRMDNLSTATSQISNPFDIARQRF